MTGASWILDNISRVSASESLYAFPLRVTLLSPFLYLPRILNVGWLWSIAFTSALLIDWSSRCLDKYKVGAYNLVHGTIMCSLLKTSVRWTLKQVLFTSPPPPRSETHNFSWVANVTLILLCDTVWTKYSQAAFDYLLSWFCRRINTVNIFKVENK